MYIGFCASSASQFYWLCLKTLSPPKCLWALHSSQSHVSQSLCVMSHCLQPTISTLALSWASALLWSRTIRMIVIIYKPRRHYHHTATSFLFLIYYFLVSALCHVGVGDSNYLLCSIRICRITQNNVPLYTVLSLELSMVLHQLWSNTIITQYDIQYCLCFLYLKKL